MSNGKTDPSDGFPLPLGRDTDLTVEHWGRIAEAILPAPSICNGTYPRKSPGNARFISRRKRIQWIGCCVGEGVTGMAETSTRTPKSIDVNTVPLTGTDLAPLWTYQVARNYSKSQGVRMGREGAIVSDALLGVQKSGFVEWQTWPDTQAAEQSYSDGSTPQAAKDARKYSPVSDSKRLTDPDQILEYLGAGYTIAVGTSWKGGSGVDSTGKFKWGGWSVGGHCYEVVDYDLDADKIVIRNSWDNIPFGVGPDGTAWTTLSVWIRQFTSQSMDDGGAEAIVVCDLDGWVPKLGSYADVL